MVSTIDIYQIQAIYNRENINAAIALDTPMAWGRYFFWPFAGGATGGGRGGSIALSGKRFQI